MTERLNLTFGPVQGFVAQARRTRDLWAGSWLLSFLAESAIVAAENTGAVMILPHRPSGDRHVATMRRDSALFGGFPNRFTAEATDPVRAAEAATRAVQSAWRQIADAVWEEYVEPASHAGAGTGEIWSRQIESFWEIAWVVGDSAALAARKNVRLVDARVEPGNHCSLMSDLQELSGHYGRGSRERHIDFWQLVRQRTPTLDLEENERLCAIALIKRLFPHISEAAVGFRLDEARSWPSTAWLAASPWIERARSFEHESADFARAVTGLPWKRGCTGERAAALRRFGSPEPEDFAALDGRLFFEAVIADPSSGELDADIDTAGPAQRLGHLYKAVGRPPQPFYAVLLMDGDRTGQVLDQARESGQRGGEIAVSQCIAGFAADVPAIIGRHDGYTVYAGGDDVLALLPASEALACAEELASIYAESFRELDLPLSATLSGGLVFAHYGVSLRNVVRFAHHALEVVAKEETGRGALAISTMQPSGTTSMWAAPWEIVTGHHPEAPGALRQLTRHFSDEGAFSKSYVHKLRERLAAFFRDVALDVRGGTVLLPGLDAGVIEAIARAEYQRPQDSNGNSEGAELPIKALLLLTREWRRARDGTVRATVGSFDFAGIRIARFLERVKG